MQTRYRAAATALLLTATAGMAATGGAAQASGTHHAGKAAKSLVITVKSKDGAIKLSDDSIRPGNTIFKVENIDGKASKGDIQMLRFKGGYTIEDLFNDLDGLFGGDTATVQRVDDNVVFYGGMKAKGDGSQVSKWAINVDKVSTYYFLNTKNGNLTTLDVKGAHQDRALPSKSGSLNAFTTKSGGNQFKAGKHNKAHGWMLTKNTAAEPHFVDLEQVKKGTKNSDITAWFDNTAPPPLVHGGDKVLTGVVSPGHKFLWSYDVKPAAYMVTCFFPSRADGMNGMPHAFMGMHIVTHLG